MDEDKILDLMSSLYLSTGVSDAAKAWNQERQFVIASVWKNLFDSLKREIREDLTVRVRLSQLESIIYLLSECSLIASAPVSGSPSRGSRMF